METKKLPLEQVLLKKAWDIYKKRANVLIPLTLIPLVLSFICSFFLTEGSSLSIILPWLLFYILTSILIDTWSAVATFLAVKEAFSISQALKKGWPLILPYIWVNILSGIAVLAGFMAFIIPGILFAIWFSLARYICIFEKERGLDALLKSAQYVKGIGWRVFWYFFFVVLVAAVINVALGIITSFTGFGFILEAITWILILPLFYIYTYLVYDAIRTYKGTVTIPQNKGWYRILLIFGTILLGLSFFWGFKTIAPLLFSAHMNEANFLMQNWQ